MTIIISPTLGEIMESLAALLPRLLQTRPVSRCSNGGRILFFHGDVSLNVLQLPCTQTTGDIIFCTLEDIDLQ